MKPFKTIIFFLIIIFPTLLLNAQNLKDYDPRLLEMIRSGKAPKEIEKIYNEQFQVTLSGKLFPGITKAGKRITGNGLADPYTSLDGHYSDVHGIAFNNTGTLIVSVGLDGTIRYWNPNDGTLIRTIIEEYSINTVAFSPDGAKLATCGNDSKVKIWNSSDGSLLFSMVGHSNIVRSVAFSQDGTKLASGSDDNSIKIWNPNAGSLLRTITGHTSSVYSVAFSSDGTKLVSGSYDNTLKIWNPNTGSLQRTLTGHTSGINSVAFSPDGTKIASGSNDRTVKIWNSNDGTMIRSLGGHVGGVLSVAFSSDGTKIVSGSSDSTIKIWNPNDGALQRTITGDASFVNSVNFSPDGTKLASGNDAGTIKIRNSNDGTLIRTLIGHASFVYSVAFSPDGTKLASASLDNKIKIWNPNDGTLIRTIAGHGSIVMSISFSPDGTKLASGSYDNTIKIWNPNDGTLIRTLSGSIAPVTTVDFSSDGTKLASGGGDQAVRIWNPNTGTLLRTMTGHTNWISSVKFSPDGTKLASGSDDNTIKIWDPNNGTLLRTLTGHSSFVNSIAFSLDGTKLISGSWDYTIKVWNPNNGTLIRTITGHGGTVNSIACSPDGTKFISGSDDHTIKIWNLNDGTLLRTIDLDYYGRPFSIYYSPDGSKIASGGSGYKNLRIYNVATTYTISGTVTLGGIGLSGVTLTLSGSSSGTVVTDASGNYSFTVTAGGTYTVIPSKTNYTFTPTSQTFTNISSNQTQNFIATVTTYTISGTVTSSGVGLSGVTMTLSGSSSGTATTDASGNYSFTVGAGGNYTVTPSKTNYTFSPTSQTFTNISSNQTQNFIATLNPYTISGTVTSGGAGLNGVTMTLSGSSSGTVTTDASGNYSFTVNAGGTYTVTPSKTNYAFNPAGQTFTNVSSSQIQNFIASLNPYIISGTITLGGTGFSGVTVTLSGSSSGSIITNASGNYSFTVSAGGTYTITPSKANYTFNPTSQTFTNLSSNQTQNFTASIITYTISGSITSGGVGLSGAAVSMSGSSVGIAVTDANGYYSFTVNAGGTYTIMPLKMNYSFSPAIQTFSNISSNQSQNFTATLNNYTLSGTITSGGAGLSGVTVTLSGSSSGTVTTDANGYYSFTVSAGGTYTITPSKTNYTFNPTSQTFANITSDQIQNFTATLNSYIINGNITTGGTGLSGVTIALSGSSSGVAVSDANGYYSFTVSPGGTYTITPSLSNYTFDPTSQTFTGISNNQTQNFTATLNTYSISGTITLSGGGLSGVTVTLSGSSSGTTLTDAAGYFSFSVNAGGTYIITPSKTNYAFNPTSQTFTNISGNQTQNFTATMNAYTISGIITSGGTGLSGVMVSLSGSSSGTALTDASGYYSFSVNAGGTYIITPVKEYYTFNLSNKTITNISGNQTQNFTATMNVFTISGTITIGGVGLNGVTISLSGSSNGTTTTDASGYYSFTVSPGGTYTITPSKTNYSFNPTSQTFTNITGNQTQNFTAALNSFTISGTITSSGTGLSGVTLTLSGSSSGTTLTNVNGYYSFTVSAGGNYIITPTKTNFTFTPPYRSYNNLSSNQDNQNFVSSQPSISIDQTFLQYYMIENGQTPSSQYITIKNGSGGTLDWSVSSNASWLMISPTAGRDYGVITVRVNPGNLQPGLYSTIITINASNASNSPQNINVTFNIISIPKLTTMGNTKADLGNDKNISFSLTTNVAPKSVYTFYKLGGDIYYDSVQAYFSNSNYSFTIPKEKITARGIDYYIKLNYDNFSTIIFDSLNNYMPMSLQVRINSVEPDYKMKVYKYSMVSALDFDGTTLFKEAINSLGPVDNTQWRLLRWVGGRYEEYLTEKSLSLKSGDGFWIISANDKKFILRNCLTTQSNIPYRILLEPGWNQIGNPFLFPVSVSNIDIPQGKKIEKLWGWDNQIEDYRPFDGVSGNYSAIQPWNGYFIKNNETDPVGISIKPIYYQPKQMSSFAKNENTGTKSSLSLNYGEWKIFVKIVQLQQNELSSQNLSSALNNNISNDNSIIQFGCLNDSRDEWDYNDLSEPPPAPSNNIVGNSSKVDDHCLQIRFPHPEWLECKGNYVRDFRSIGKNVYVWDMNISKANAPSADCLFCADFKLNFEILGDFPESFEMVVYDYDVNRVIGDYSLSKDFGSNIQIPIHFQENQQIKLIRITVGISESIEKDKDLRAVKYTLWQNYPNPFNPSTRIEYSVPENSFITINIFNALGNNIQTLISKNHTRGIYSIDWKPESIPGGLPSGVYFYRLEVSGLTQSETEKYSVMKKMLYIR